MAILDFAGRVIDPVATIGAIKGGTVIGQHSFAGMQVPIIRHGPAGTSARPRPGASGGRPAPRPAAGPGQGQAASSGASGSAGGSFREEDHPRGPDGKFRASGSGPAATPNAGGGSPGGAPDPTRTHTATATAPSPPTPAPLDTSHPAYAAAVRRAGHEGAPGPEHANSPGVRAAFERITNHPIASATTEDREATLRSLGIRPDQPGAAAAIYDPKVQAAFDRLGSQGRLPSRRRSGISRFLASTQSAGRADHPAVAAARAPEGSPERARLDAAIERLSSTAHLPRDLMREMAGPEKWATRGVVQSYFDELKEAATATASANASASRDASPHPAPPAASPQAARPGPWQPRTIDNVPSRHLIDEPLKALSWMFGRALTHEDVRSLVGAPADAIVRSSVVFEGPFPRGRIVFHGTTERGGDAIRYAADRSVMVDRSNHQVTISNECFACQRYDPTTEQFIPGGNGQGLEVFSKQVETASSLGASRINTYAARQSGHYNGYYTWPQFGYDGKVPVKGDWPAWAKERKTFAQMFADQRGRDFWRLNGQSVPLAFNLDPSGYSMGKLREYRASREKVDANRGAA